MRGLVIVGILALGLGGCLQQMNERAGGRCEVTASKPWTPAAGTELTVEAGTLGADCEHAVATIVIRDQSGVAYAQAYPTAQVMDLAQARDSRAMRTALGEWIQSANHTIDTTSALPDWPEGAEGPQNGEFPFYVAEGFTRETYMALRERNAPVFCYVQGMESEKCLALEDGVLSEIGIQSFPG